VSTLKNARALSGIHSVVELIKGSTDVQRSGSTSEGPRYTFTPPRFVSRDPKLQVSYSDATAIVRHSRLRNITFGATIVSNGKAQTGRSRLEFSHYGAVGPIEAPSPDELLPGQLPCLDGLPRGGIVGMTGG
jgi:hypothetical protein